MSRRTGKAATRRARQQKRAKQGPAPAAASSPPIASEAPTEVTAAAAAADATARRASSPRPATPAYAGVAATSRLGAEAQQEYHYVVSDLRNTGILVLVMAGLLAAAVVIVNLASAAP